jgi:hypothetical protein
MTWLGRLRQRLGPPQPLRSPDDDFGQLRLLRAVGAL